jgi:serine/threonine-protein kinase
VGVPIVADSRNYAYPRYSPDGHRIAVAIASSGERDIWVVDVANGTASRLTSNASVNDRPEWTPDGKRVLYRTARSRRSALWWRAADMSDSESPLLANETSDFYEGVFSPNGRYLVYQIDTAGADVLYRQLSGDTASRPIANTQFTEDMARVSPDGRWVAFVSLETGGEEVFVQPFPGPGPRVQVSLRGGNEPVWSPDGRRLFYRNEENVMAASINSSGGLAVTSREVLFADGFVKRALPHANFDVSPNGGKFLFLKAMSEPEAVVVYNWMNEVRGKVAASDSR